MLIGYLHSSSHGPLYLFVAYAVKIGPPIIDTTSHAAKQLSQFMQCPCKQHWDVAHHLLRYLKGTSKKGLFFPTGAPSALTAYCDADWAFLH
ncbi:UNVERIFIED_CONTAM: hypothetical protein Sradi_3000500 [Sesamum radiatum]|uniref:Uncharacterized protein n=1 Tax=Sesamum radiatum TaxID=300843 RepID=A0AAW2S1T3_SESRA